MGNAVRRKGAPGDDQPVGADDPEDAHTKLVGTCPVVTVEKHHFG
jgi:hypothetical protein